MVTVEYYIVKLLGKFAGSRGNKLLNKWFASKGVHLPRGGNCYINSNIAKNEPHLIWIGENTTVGGSVEFVTHDNSISKVIPNTTDLFGKIVIGKNCFIGARAVIMYGVTIADNVIVAAGSVVTKSVVEENVIIAGNPAKIISSWDCFAENSAPYAWNLYETSRKDMISETLSGKKLISR